jgi:hypothetical protein
MPRAGAAADPELKPETAPRAGSLLSQAYQLSDDTEYVNGVWTGDQGTGKTTDIATLANLGRTIVINAEGGFKKRPLERLGVNTANLEFLPRDPAELSYDYLDTLYWELKAQLEKDPKSIAGVLWDSITDIHVKILRNVVDYQLQRAARQQVSRIKDAAPGDMINEFFTDLSDYGIMTGQLRLELRRYRDLPCHFLVTALQRRDIDDDGKVKYRPAVTPALAKDLEQFFDIVCNTSVVEMADGGEDEYRGLFRPVGKYVGKDRFGATPKRLIDPTFERVLQYIQDEIDIDSDPVMAEARKRHAAIAQLKGAKAVDEAEGKEPEEEPGDDAE